MLIIDDEPTVLTSLARLLRPDGIRLLCANSGDQALAMLAESGESVSVVMTDYTMPGMDQYQVGEFDPDLLELLEAELRGARLRGKERPILVADLKPGMVLAEGLRATSGAIVISAGQALTVGVLERVQRFVAAGALETLSVTLEDRADDDPQPAEAAA